MSWLYDFSRDHTHTHTHTLCKGSVLVTDAMSGMGVSGEYFSLGEGGRVEVVGGAARLAGTTTLAGRLVPLSHTLTISLSPSFSHSLSLTPSPLYSLATMDQCVCQFIRATNCRQAVALRAASLHPAQVLRLGDRGTLEPGARADLVLLDREMSVQSTIIAGEPVWTRPSSRMATETQRYQTFLEQYHMHTQ